MSGPRCNHSVFTARMHKIAGFGSIFPKFSRGSMPPDPPPPPPRRAWACPSTFWSAWRQKEPTRLDSCVRPWIVKIEGDYQCMCTCVCCVRVSWWNVVTNRSSATGDFFARQWILKQIFRSKSLHWSLRAVHSAAVLFFILAPVRPGGLFHLLPSLCCPTFQPPSTVSIKPWS